jgi:predicted Co/Zn/Cd cation transporter (cation efflux family)
MSGAAVAALERRALVVSMVATSVLAAMGVVWGVVASSSVVLFDGVYAILGIGLTWLSYQASKLVAAGPTPRYPFGREALAPLVIAIQGVALLATCLYASIDAVLTILDGGSEVSADSALLYGVVSFVAALVVWLWLRRAARHSELLGAEALQWLAGTALSLGMIVAFGAVLVIRGTDYADAGRYADPALVLVACAVLVTAPVRMIRTTLVELLEGAPDPEIQAPVRRAVAEVTAEFGLDDPYLRMTKVGRKLYVEADFVVPPDEWDVADADAVRFALLGRLEGLPHQVWLNVDLSGDPAWGDA